MHPVTVLRYPTILKCVKNVPSLLLTNACHILNKIDELSAIVEINGPDIICISESWLDSSISDSITIIIYILVQVIPHIEKTEKPSVAV